MKDYLTLGSSQSCVGEECIFLNNHQPLWVLSQLIKPLVGTEFILSTRAGEQDPVQVCSEWIDHISLSLPDNNLPGKLLFVYVIFPIRLTERSLRMGVSSGSSLSSTVPKALV